MPSNHLKRALARGQKRWTAAGLIAATAVAILFSACATTPPVIDTPSAAASAPRLHAVYAVRHDWHVGWVLPQAAITTRVPALGARFPHSRWVEIGWGDKGFYQAGEVKASLALEAGFYSSGSVIHAVGLPTGTPSAFEAFPSSEIVEICLTQSELDGLLAFVAQSFARSADAAISLGPGIYGDSQFYVGTGRFHLLNTCNKWVAKGIASMGIDFSPAFKLTASSVLDGLRERGRVTREGINGVISAPLGAACGVASK